MGTAPAILAHHPPLADRLPWVSLGCWPTPVERLHRLSHQLGADLWVKRDDLSGPLYGGNKVRKLELLLAAAVAGEKHAVLTVGGIGSNHVVATGLYADQLGLAARAVVVPQPVTAHVQHSLELTRALGVELIPCPARVLVPLYMAAARRKKPACHVIGPGGSSPLGIVGFVSAALELGQQVREGLLPEPDEIFVALGSGGSMAGLVLGCALAGLACRVVGVAVVERVLANATRVRMLVRQTARLLEAAGVPPPRQAPRMRVLHGYLGGRYGCPTPAAESALELAQRTEGLALETTYTAKTLAALIDRRQGSGATILFWNTHNSRDTRPLLARRELAPLPAVVEGWLQR
jgi:D-cysteine desulfhydrase